jgi:hypothetical protein
MRFHKFDNGDLGKIFIPKLSPDAQEFGMLAAMYSRSTLGVESMVSKVQKEGAAGRFMETYLTGYGHESIGDLVHTMIFLEGIPLYLAPLIEHYALFAGQESSTRYIDFTSQRLYGPAQDLMKAMMRQYFMALEKVKEAIVKAAGGVPDSIIQIRAINARTFDICRCLLPLGVTTNVAWYGDIRSIKGHLAWMATEHPWSHKWVAGIYDALQLVYPQSLERSLGNVRPRQPWVFDEGDGRVVFEGMLDFGSWRDLNRHRVGRHDPFKLPDRSAAFHPWYLNIFSQAGYEYPTPVLQRVMKNIDPGTLQLGQTREFRYEMPESQADYFCARRNQLDVHPTLRLQVQDLALRTGRAEEYVPDVGLGYVEKRGEQTILRRQEQGPSSAFIGEPRRQEQGPSSAFIGEPCTRSPVL